MRRIGLENYVRLPRVVLLGLPESGKSSLLESIVGFDFLPKGDTPVTRRPLELRLHNQSEGTQPWAQFETEQKGVKLYDWFALRNTISGLTNQVCGQGRNIIDEPLVLNIYSPECPNLTIVDLPSITAIPLEGQP